MGAELTVLLELKLFVSSFIITTGLTALLRREVHLAFVRPALILSGKP